MKGGSGGERNWGEGIANDLLVKWVRTYVEDWCISDQGLESPYEYDLGLFLDEFTVVYVGGVVSFFVNNFLFPEAEGGREGQRRSKYLLCL